MNPIAKGLILSGLVLVIAGLLWQFGDKVFPSALRLGRLPGDFVFEKGNTRFYFPLATSILISVVLSLLAYLVNRIGK